MSDKSVKCGIFWAIPNELTDGQSALEFSKCFMPNEANSAGFINYPYSHFEMWNELKGKLSKYDCYHFPRGRVIFDKKHNKYLIYADNCVSNDVIDEIIMLYEIEEYKLCRDEHYVCPKCEKV